MLSERTSRAIAGVSSATRKNGVRIKHLFRIMTHCPDLWMLAYSNIYSNKGALTRGVDNNTLDGMCRDRIENLMTILREGRYEPKPAKRIHIPKKNGKTRPLGLPTGDDKLVQEVVRILLGQIYEPIFSDASHGFRPKRSCHTALMNVAKQWKGIRWVVEKDVKGFYDNIDHQKLIEVLERKIDDDKFIKIIKLLLRAGYLEDWKFRDTHSGTPQGGICSPILANIFLHEFDKFMEAKINAFNIGKWRRRFQPYHALIRRQRSLRDRMYRLQRLDASNPEISILKEEIRKLDAEAKKLPSGDPNDPGYRRLHYIRYADDFACGIIGSKEDAEKLSHDVSAFLEQELKLHIDWEKSAIRHAEDGFRFLGYHLESDSRVVRLRKSKYGVTKDGKTVYGTTRAGRNNLILKLPAEKVWEFCRRKGYLFKDKPIHKNQRISLSDYEIVSAFNAEMRGFANPISRAH